MWNASGPSAAKATTSAAEARKVALLCGHHLDLRVLAMASAVRLNGGTIDQMANPFSSSDQGGDQQPLSCVALWSTCDLVLHQIELQVIGSTRCDCFAR
jgi:hypothetical protein